MIRSKTYGEVWPDGRVRPRQEGGDSRVRQHANGGGTGLATGLRWCLALSGPCCLVAGLGMYDVRAGIITLGVLLMYLDARD